MPDCYNRCGGFCCLDESRRKIFKAKMVFYSRANNTTSLVLFDVYKSSMGDVLGIFHFCGGLYQRFLQFLDQEGRMLTTHVRSIDIPNIIYTFNTNQLGIHNTVSAKIAQHFFGARRGSGEGLFGCSYAISTNDFNGCGMSLQNIKGHIQRFLDTCEMFPHLHFFVTKVGSGLTGYKESSIIEIFNELYPTYEKLFISNVTLPTSWQIHLGLIDQQRYTIVAGSRSIEDYNLVQSILNQTRVGTIISGCAPGIDSLAIKWAKDTGTNLIKVPAPWKHYNGDKRVGNMRNSIMANLATDCIIIWDGQSTGSNDMFKIATREGLNPVLHKQQSVMN